VALGLVVVLIRRFGFDGGLVAASSWDVVDPAAAGQCVSGGAAPARPISRPYRGGGGGGRASHPHLRGAPLRDGGPGEVDAADSDANGWHAAGRQWALHARTRPIRTLLGLVCLRRGFTGSLPPTGLI
jgi:hypothetical protein